MTSVPSNPSPLVSVVTPFHNTAAYLEECIQSVLGQTYSNWEYILYDNCSDDGSTEIAEAYAKRDARVRFIRSDVLVDQLPNYNRALREISPESRYCKFVQADDWIFPSCLTEMVGLALTRPSIGLVGSYSLYEGDDEKVGHAGLPFSRWPVFSGEDAARRFLRAERGFFGSPSCVLYRSDFVRAKDSFYMEVSDFCEDLDACLEILAHADFGFVFQVLTFNRRTNPSITARIQPYGPDLMHSYVLTHKFGRQVFSDDEFQWRMDRLARRYYSLLASGVLLRKGPKFWEFHRAGLRAVNLDVNRRQLVFAVIAELGRAILNPWRTLTKVARRSK